MEVSESLFTYGGSGQFGGVNFRFQLASDEIEDAPPYQRRRCQAQTCFRYTTEWRIGADQVSWVLVIEQDDEPGSFQRFSFQGPNRPVVQQQLDRIAVRSADGSVNLTLGSFAAEE